MSVYGADSSTVDDDDDVIPPRKRRRVLDSDSDDGDGDVEGHETAESESEGSVMDAGEDASGARQAQRELNTAVSLPRLGDSDDSSGEQNNAAEELPGSSGLVNTSLEQPPSVIMSNTIIDDLAALLGREKDTTRYYNDVDYLAQTDQTILGRKYNISTYQRLFCDRRGAKYIRGPAFIGIDPKLAGVFDAHKWSGIFNAILDDNRYSHLILPFPQSVLEPNHKMNAKQLPRDDDNANNANNGPQKKRKYSEEPKSRFKHKTESVSLLFLMSDPDEIVSPSQPPPPPPPPCTSNVGDGGKVLSRYR